MLYLLSDWSHWFGPLRLFEYLTFRAGGAAVTAFLLVLLLGGATARYLNRLNTVAADRYAGLLAPEVLERERRRKPCMGGILIVGAVTLAGVLWNNLTNPISWALILTTLALMCVGFFDDYMKVVHKNRDGMPGKVKLALQTLIAAAVVYFLDSIPATGTLMRQLMVPFLKDPVVTHWWVLAFEVVVIVGASNAVNLTDGKDGLAAGCTIFCTLTYAVFAYVMGHRIFAGYLSVPYIPGCGEALVYAAALAGACIGFLWHNCEPASMIMGDTGSLALGGAVGLLAVLVRQEILLVLVGGVFVMEAVSVMIQVVSFKTTGKRVFLCTPIHHHFERRNWADSQIVVRFWILSGVFALLALASLKLR